MTTCARMVRAGKGIVRFATTISVLFITAFFFIAGSIPAQAQLNLNFKRVSVNWPTVDCYFSVVCNGTPAYGMMKSDFELYDNGQEIQNFSLTCPAPMSRCALSTALVFDASGSMTGVGNAAAISAGRAFVDVMDGVVDEATVMYFNQDVTVMQQMTTLKPMLYAAIDNLPASGQTAMWDGAFDGVIELINNGINDCRAVILLSDGYDNSSQHSMQEIADLAASNRIRVYTVGLGSSVPVTQLEQLALQTGGRFYNVANPNMLPEVYREISTIMLMGFQECRITYDATCGDGQQHAVELHMPAFCSGSDVKTRTYRAAQDSTTYTPLAVSIPDTAGFSGNTLSIPLTLETDLDGATLPPFSFTVETSQSCFSHLSFAIPAGSLLEGVPVNVSPVNGGVRMWTTERVTLDDPGTLMELRLTLATVQDTTCCDVVIRDVQFLENCYRLELQGGRVCVYPRLPEVFCDLDYPDGVRWYDSMKKYQPDPFTIKMMVFNTGNAAAENVRYRITYDSTVVTRVAPQSDTQYGTPAEIQVSGMGVAEWQMTPVYRSTDDSTLICVEAMFDNHRTITCCTKLFIAGADASLRCIITAEDIHVDSTQQLYTPEPFQLSAAVTNHGPSPLSNVTSQIVLPPELKLAGTDAPDKYIKTVLPSTIAAQTTGIVGWELAPELPYPVQALDVPVIVRTVSDQTDTSECSINVHIPAMAFPFAFALTADGPLTICEGESVTLDAGEGYRSYIWSNHEVSRTITVQSAGTYWCRVIEKTGLIGYSDTVTVTVRPAPAPAIQIIGSNPLCEGDTLTLSADPGYVSYQWNTGEDTRAIQVTKGGLYSVVVTDADGCVGGSEPVQVNMLPAPAKPFINRTGDLLSSTPAASYQWLRNYVPIPGATGQEYQLSELGAYVVEITDSNGCTARSNVIQVSVLDARKLPAAIEALDLYPNPASGQVTLYLRLPSPGYALAEVHDLLGRRILQQRLRVGINGVRATLNVEGLQPGMYFVRVSSAGSSVVRRLMLTQ
ncbi:VWA domain-containing protein [bacterium]|nr:VWA domain-containing protein [bacterium]